MLFYLSPVPELTLVNIRNCAASSPRTVHDCRTEQMTSITPRTPQVEWNQGFERHRNGGNPTVSPTFNALSLLFPQGAKYFIDVARKVARTVKLPANQELSEEIRGFVAQQAIHTCQHAQYNAVLDQLGYRNVVNDYIDRVVELTRRHLSPLTNLAMVYAYEHYTAILGDFVLSNPQVLAPAPPGLALIWDWHGAEETEHKAVCFDLYREAGGGWLRRVLTFALVTLNFSVMFLRAYFHLLHTDGCLKPARLPRTLAQALRFHFGAPGLVWHSIAQGIPYLAPASTPGITTTGASCKPGSPRMPRGCVNSWLAIHDWEMSSLESATHEKRQPKLPFLHRP